MTMIVFIVLIITDISQISVSVAHYSAFRAHSNFKEPDSFLPERWIDYKDPSNPFHSDRREALQPFSYGPRACIGRKYAVPSSHLLFPQRPLTHL